MNDKGKVHQLSVGSTTKISRRKTRQTSWSKCETDSPEDKYIEEKRRQTGWSKCKTNSPENTISNTISNKNYFVLRYNAKTPKNKHTRQTSWSKCETNSPEE